MDDHVRSLCILVPGPRYVSAVAQADEAAGPRSGGSSGVFDGLPSMVVPLKQPIIAIWETTIFGGTPFLIFFGQMIRIYFHPYPG